MKSYQNILEVVYEVVGLVIYLYHLAIEWLMDKLYNFPEVTITLWGKIIALSTSYCISEIQMQYLWKCFAKCKGLYKYFKCYLYIIKH